MAIVTAGNAAQRQQDIRADEVEDVKSRWQSKWAVDMFRHAVATLKYYQKLELLHQELEKTRTEQSLMVDSFRRKESAWADELDAMIGDHNSEIASLSNTVETLTKNHGRELATIKESHKMEIIALKAKHADEMTRLHMHEQDAVAVIDTRKVNGHVNDAASKLKEQLEFTIEVREQLATQVVEMRAQRMHDELETEQNRALIEELNERNQQHQQQSECGEQERSKLLHDKTVQIDELRQQLEAERKAHSLRIAHLDSEIANLKIEKTSQMDSQQFRVDELLEKLRYDELGEKLRNEQAVADLFRQENLEQAETLRSMEAEVRKRYLSMETMRGDLDEQIATLRKEVTKKDLEKERECQLRAVVEERCNSKVRIIQDRLSEIEAREQREIQSFEMQQSLEPKAQSDQAENLKSLEMKMNLLKEQMNTQRNASSWELQMAAREAMKLNERLASSEEFREALQLEHLSEIQKIELGCREQTSSVQSALASRGEEEFKAMEERLHAATRAAREGLAEVREEERRLALRQTGDEAELLKQIEWERSTHAQTVSLLKEELKGLKDEMADKLATAEQAVQEMKRGRLEEVRQLQERLHDMEGRQVKLLSMLSRSGSAQLDDGLLCSPGSTENFAYPLSAEVPNPSLKQSLTTIEQQVEALLANFKDEASLPGVSDASCHEKLLNLKTRIQQQFDKFEDAEDTGLVFRGVARVDASPFKMQEKQRARSPDGTLEPCQEMERVTVRRQRSDGDTTLGHPREMEVPAVRRQRSCADEVGTWREMDALFVRRQRSEGGREFAHASTSQMPTPFGYQRGMSASKRAGSPSQPALVRLSSGDASLRTSSPSQPALVRVATASMSVPLPSNASGLEGPSGAFFSQPSLVRLSSGGGAARASSPSQRALVRLSSGGASARVASPPQKAMLRLASVRDSARASSPSQRSLVRRGVNSARGSCSSQVMVVGPSSGSASVTKPSSGTASVAMPPSGTASVAMPVPSEGAATPRIVMPSSGTASVTAPLTSSANGFDGKLTPFAYSGNQSPRTGACALNCMVSNVERLSPVKSSPNASQNSSATIAPASAGGTMNLPVGGGTVIAPVGGGVGRSFQVPLVGSPTCMTPRVRAPIPVIKGFPSPRESSPGRGAPSSARVGNATQRQESIPVSRSFVPSEASPPVVAPHEKAPVARRTMPSSLRSGASPTPVVVTTSARKKDAL